MIILYKQSFKKHVSALSTTIISAVLLAILLFLFYETEVLVKALITFIMLSSLPVAYLHYQYFKINQNSVFIIDKENQELEYVQGSTKVKVAFKDIEKITLYLTFPYKGGYRSTLFDEYHFAEIISSSGGRIIFTSLLVINVESALNHIDGVQLTKKTVFFPSISKSLRNKSR